MAEDSSKKPKKKRGRPKGTKNKPKAEAPKTELKKDELSKEVKKETTKIESKEKAKQELISSSEPAAKAAEAAAEAAAKAEAEARAALERSEAAKKAAEAAAEEEYKAAAAEVEVADAGRGMTNKRGAERIFRREMGEPEFWLDKNDRVPPRPVLSQAEEEKISREVEIQRDQTPRYEPQHILSPEYGGISNYERGVKIQREELEQRLARLKGDPNASAQEINQAEEDLKTLDYLFENYHDGMNVFRTAKGGRAKLRE